MCTKATALVGFTKESLKVVQNFRNHQRYERSRETDAIIEAKFQLVSLLDISISIIMGAFESCLFLVIYLFIYLLLLIITVYI